MYFVSIVVERPLYGFQTFPLDLLHSGPYGLANFAGQHSKRRQPSWTHVARPTLACAVIPHAPVPRHTTISHNGSVRDFLLPHFSCVRCGLSAYGAMISLLLSPFVRAIGAIT